MKLHIIHHPDETLVRLLSSVINNERRIMATIEELVGAVDELTEAVNDVGTAVDEMEVKLTEALKNAGLTPEQQAAVDAALEGVRGATQKARDVAADARDGVDESQTPPSTEEPPSEEPQA